MIILLRRALAVSLTAFVLLSFVSCKRQRNPTMYSGPSPTALHPSSGGATLVRPADAGELEAKIKTELARRYERQYDSSVYRGSTVATAAGAVSGQTGAVSQSQSAEGGDAGTAAPAFSATNVQEQGVDEGDLVKTDGKYVYLARGTRFVILTVDPAQDSAVLSDTDLNEQISELLLSGAKVVLITSPVTVYPVGGTSLMSATVIPFRPVTHVYVYDVSSPDLPILAASFDFPGQVRGSRRIGNILYLITNTVIELPSPAQPADFLTSGATSTDPQAFITACERARQENLRRVQAASLSELLPSYKSIVYAGSAGTSATAPAASPSTTFLAQPANGTDLSVVVSLDLSAAPPTTATASVVAAASQVYVSRDSLYLASANSWQWIEPLPGSAMPSGNPDPGTTVHKFALDASGKPVYKGSGVVEGWVNDRFSMGDHNGYLRLGTTRGGWWGESISNQMTVLTEDAGAPGRLTVIARIRDIAPGERIYAMRFDRDRGYVVTFKQTDPLFTFDLSDPAGPRLAGTVKVNGFATYIHLLGPETAPRLLTIGRSADSAGRVTGNKLQLFDVKDMEAPRLSAEYELGQGWSNALFDPHAFLYYEPLRLLAIPYSGYIPNTYSLGSGLQVFTVSDAAITPNGTIPAPSIPSAYGSYPDTVDRSIVINNAIFAVAGRSVTVAAADTLNIIKTVELPQAQPYPYPLPGTGTAVAGTGTAVAGQTTAAPAL